MSIACILYEENNYMLTAGFLNNVSLSTIVLNSGDCDKEYMASLV